ncbi:MAG: prepilin-type N-terminal cleavage/methylation domain-containing protein [bacterium]|nr:prepilin-type N-terminal cleavage/methylation domain-containing protein [bacterium]
MNNNHNQNNNTKLGFTIIEVVLVLAVAGLIFLMVFIALPALQRSQRNQAYKNNVSMAISLIQRYKANNKTR